MDKRGLCSLYRVSLPVSLRRRLFPFLYLSNEDLARIVKREASKIKPQPFIPIGFSGKEFINRLRHSIEVMDFCPKRLVHNWVDYSEMIVIQAPPGTDCSQACRTKGLTCNAEMLSFINQKRFLTNFWQKCKNIIKITSRSYWSLGYPAINGQNCILQVTKCIFKIRGGDFGGFL